MKTAVILQEVLLNQVRREQIPVWINMLDGEKRKGVVKGFDSFTIILESAEGDQVLVYKHAISSIIPQGYVQLSQRKPHEERN